MYVMILPTNINQSSIQENKFFFTISMYHHHVAGPSRLIVFLNMCRKTLAGSEPYFVIVRATHHASGPTMS